MASSATAAHLHPQRAIFSEVGLGASEVTAVCGLNKWHKPFQVWERRIEPGHDDGDTYLSRRGRAFEPGVLELLEHEAGVKVEPNRVPKQWDKDPILFATCDGFVVSDEREPAEVKAPGPRTWHEWFDEDGDPIIPDRYVVQNAIQVLVHDAPRGLVAADLGTQMVWRWLERDKKLERDLVGIVRDFWDRYVVTKTPPPVDGSDQAEAFLARRFPRDTGDFLEYAALAPEAAARFVMLAERGRLLREDRKRAEDAYKAVKNEIRQFIGNARGVEIPGLGNVTWKNNKDQESTQWEPLAQQAMAAMPDQEAAQQLLQDHTTTHPGSRVLRLGKVPATKVAKKRATK